MPTEARGATDVAVLVRRWAMADPRNMTSLLMLPLVAADVVEQFRWSRANGVNLWSRAGTVAYVKARPLRFALSVALSLAPDAVGAVVKRRRAAG